MHFGSTRDVTSLRLYHALFLIVQIFQEIATSRLRNWCIHYKTWLKILDLCSANHEHISIKSVSYLVGVNGYNALPVSFTISFHWIQIGVEQLFTRCGFKCGLHRCAESDRKHSEFGPERRKIIRWICAMSHIFTVPNNTNKKLYRVQKSYKILPM
jgi:hypothetical protein